MACWHRVRAYARRDGIAIIDIGLPDGDGCDLMVELASQHGLYGIALTAHGLALHIERCLRAGYVHMLKPFRLNVLLSSVSEMYKAQ